MIENNENLFFVNTLELALIFLFLISEVVRGPFITMVYDIPITTG